MANIFFTADLHLGHTRIIEYCKRPFSSIGEMDEVIINNWNSVVRDLVDVVYVLGDFCFGSTEQTEKYIRRLNGTKIFLQGSHDKGLLSLIRKKPGFVLFKGYMYVLKVQGAQFTHEITLNHYSMRTWPKSHYNTWHLYGHSHGKLEGWGKSFDVGVDAWNFYPVSLEQVEKEMDKLPDNFNLVNKEVR